MPILREDLARALAVHEPDALRAILDAAEVSYAGHLAADGLARRIVDALWWNYHTPAGYLARPATLEDIVGYVAHRLRVELDGPTDGWTQLRQLTLALARETSSRVDVGAARGVRYDDLDPALHQRLDDGWFSTAAFSTLGAGSVSAGAAGRAVLWVGRSPIGRVLPWLPRVGALWRSVHGVGRIAALLGGPLAIAAAVIALNQALGTHHRRLVPLLLGVGALGPGPVTEAAEVG